MKRLFSLGKIHLSLTKMHSSGGTALFKKLSPGKQNSWAAFDRKHSMRQMKRKGGF